jgi:DNA-binding transcriptional ArsR family regulator
MGEEPVTIIDREVLKVLAVDTRMDILKQLSEGARTPSDLGKRLNKSGATIVEHLEALCKAGLVKKIEQPGKKWVFYTLTDRGQCIISSKSKRLVIILAVSMLALIGGFGSFLQHSIQFGYLATKAGMEKAPLVGESGITAAFPTYLYLSIVLFAIALVGFSFYIRQKSKFKGLGR